MAKLLLAVLVFVGLVSCAFSQSAFAWVDETGNIVNMGGSYKVENIFQYFSSILSNTILKYEHWIQIYRYLA